jgi:hypothetical protein
MRSSDNCRKLTLKIFFPEGGFKCSEYKKGWTELKVFRPNNKFRPTDREFFVAISSVQLFTANETHVFFSLKPL